MTDPYRHTIDELVVRYELEPDLRDIYVEGDRDLFFLKWFFHSADCNRPIVYPILQSVDVPAQLLEQYNVSGNRGRVIALCIELALRLSPDRRSVRGLIDKDYSELLGEMPASPFLLCTEFSCIECYALSERSLTKFCHVYLGVLIPRSRFDEMFWIVVELFLLRAAKISLLVYTPWVESFTRCCSIEAGQVVLDREAFVGRLLNASAGKLNRGALEGRVAQLRARLAGDFRQTVNAHDIIRMFSWYARQIGVDGNISNQAPLQRGLMTSAEIDELQNTVLFETLSRWSTA